MYFQIFKSSKLQALIFEYNISKLIQRLEFLLIDNKKISFNWDFTRHRHVGKDKQISKHYNRLTRVTTEALEFNLEKILLISQRLPSNKIERLPRKLPLPFFMTFLEWAKIQNFRLSTSHTIQRFVNVLKIKKILIQLFKSY